MTLERRLWPRSWQVDRRVYCNFWTDWNDLGLPEARPFAMQIAVGLYVTAANWFTSSTSFASSAVTIAHGFSDTLAGIATSLLS